VADTGTLDIPAFKTALTQEWREAAPGGRRWHDPMEADDGSAAISRVLVVAPPVTALFSGQPDHVTEQVWRPVAELAWEPFAEPDGRVRLPNEAIWVSATNPS
jgi:hypothetical protein